MKEKKMPKRHGPSWQTILIILGAAALWIGLGMVLNTDGGGSGAYSSYSGPILPLTAVSGGENLEAVRHVDFDFSPYEGYRPSSISEGEVIITDTYHLTNPAVEDVIARLVYPYEGDLHNERKYTPTITVDGAEAQATLYAALDEEKSIFRAADFWEYRERMTDVDYFAQATEDAPRLDIPVKVYHFTDITYEGDQDYPYIFLTMDFKIPKDAHVWVLHFDVLGSDSEAGTHSVWFKDDLDDKDMAYLFVMNGDIEDLTFGGNLGHNVTKTSTLTDVTCEYEVYETTFDKLVWEFAQVYDYWGFADDDPDPGLVTPELLYQNALKLMADDVTRGYDGITGSTVSVVADAFYQTITAPKLQYWVFDVTIPAGETVEVEAKYHQEASTDIGGPKKRREGYDMATRLGSDLNFTDLSASITHPEFIEILRQNFGFNLKKNITRVELSLEEELYYLEVTVRES